MTDFLESGLLAIKWHISGLGIYSTVHLKYKWHERHIVTADVFSRIRNSRDFPSYSIYFCSFTYYCYTCWIKFYLVCISSSGHSSFPLCPTRLHSPLPSTGQQPTMAAAVGAVAAARTTAPTAGLATTVARTRGTSSSHSPWTFRGTWETVRWGWHWPLKKMRMCPGRYSSLPWWKMGWQRGQRLFKVIIEL